MIAVALFLTTGGHLALLQGIAWTTMVRDFAKTESLGAALEKTFDGKHPCSLCKKISQTGSAQKDSAPAPTKIKLSEFIAHPQRLLAPPSPKPFSYPAAPTNEPAEIFFAPPVPIPISVG